MSTSQWNTLLEKNKEIGLVVKVGVDGNIVPKLHMTAFKLLHTDLICPGHKPRGHETFVEMTQIVPQ